VASNGERFGIPVEQVREVVRALTIHAVPGAPLIQCGIVNVRGSIVTVLDLAALRTGERAVTPGSVVLLQHGVRPIGLAVDAVYDVRAADPDAEAFDSGAPIVSLDAVALCARHLHSAEEGVR
jgi:purine-binding chemotaxis protein CheW